MNDIMERQKVCAVVVTYNRRDLLQVCLASLMRQTRPIDALIIVDNASTDNTHDILLEKGYLDSLPPVNISEPFFIGSKKVIDKYDINRIEGETEFSGWEGEVFYIRMHNNTGGAGGFHEGVKYGYEMGFDWIWLMDDDGYPHENALEKLMLYSKKANLVALNCLVLSNKKNGKLAFQMPFLNVNGRIKRNGSVKYTKDVGALKDYAKGDLYPWGNFFNGTLISSSAVKKIGNIKKELFIWGDEQDYFYRLKQVGEIQTVLSSYHYHPDDNKQKPALWKMYYGFRNELYLNRKYRDFKFFRFFLSTVRALPEFLKEKNGLQQYFRAIYGSFKI